LLIIKKFTIPFTLGAIIITTSIALSLLQVRTSLSKCIVLFNRLILLPILSHVFLTMSLLQDVISWRSCLLEVCVLLTITSLISAGHHLEDEVRPSAMFGFSIPKWYTWNIKNRKLLLTILTNTSRLMSLKFINGLIVNNTLFVSVNILFGDDLMD
jgi:hypothetical protein